MVEREWQGCEQPPERIVSVSVVAAVSYNGWLQSLLPMGTAH